MTTDEEKRKEIANRQAIERRMIRRLVLALVKAGFKVGVFDGQEQVCKDETTWKAVKEKLFSVDDELLTVHRDGKRFGWVRLVYGNGGWDVICDYTTNLEAVVDPIVDYAGTLCE